MTHRESHIWDRDAVALQPDLFYESYFQDYQHLMDLRQKGNARIQSFNVKITRQEKSHPNEVVSSTANREKLEGMFRTALYTLFEAFEQAYQFEHSETVMHLRDELVTPAIAHMSHFFASSRCRTCYKGRKLDAAWRRSRFNTLLPLLAKISPEVYRQAEEHQATLLLEKTAIEDHFALPDCFKLGFSDEDKAIIMALRGNRAEGIYKRTFSFRQNQYSYPFIPSVGKPKGHTSTGNFQLESRGTSANSPTQATKPSSYCPSAFAPLPGTPR